MSTGLSATLGALADDSRLAAVQALAEGSLSVGELAERLDVAPAALTRHLRVLREAGLVRVTLDPGDNRRHIYTVQPGPLEGLGLWANQVARFWMSQLASYADETKAGDARR